VALRCDPDTALGLLADRVGRMGAGPLFEIPDGPGWRALTADEVWRDVERLARGLVAAGVEVGARVGILSTTRYEWLLADFALWSVGAVPVPLYESSSAAQIAWIAQDAGLVTVFVADDEQRRRAAGAWPGLGALGGPWVFDEGAVARLGAAGQTVPADQVAQRCRAVRPDDLATIVYTSGTTGRPRGARITHANLAVHVRNTVVGLRPVVWDGAPRLLQFLPLAHVYARVTTLVAIAARTTVGLVPSAVGLAADARSFRPTYLVAVPRVLEKVAAAAEATAGGGLRSRLFAWARGVAVERSRAAQPGPDGVAARRAPGDVAGERGPGAAAAALALVAALVVGVRHAIADLLVLRRLRRSLGGALRYVVVGGSAAYPPLAHFFRGIGVDVLEGYGLTETCAQTTVNRPGAAVIGSVGTPLPGCRVRIGDDGEVLVAGPHLFAGYQGEPPRQGEWLATGDLGRLDAAGNLYLTGRSRDILVTAAGKNVSPAPLEDAVRACPLVAECVVVGEGRPFVAALLTLDEEALAAWCRARGRPPLGLAQAGADDELRAELAAAVDRANAEVSRAESIREFVVLDRPLTLRDGHLTPSLKVRRDAVLAQFAGTIDALYATAATRRAATP
jgi:long-chain acyl-CoA synthetase